MFKTGDKVRFVSNIYCCNQEVNYQPSLRIGQVYTIGKNCNLAYKCRKCKKELRRWYIVETNGCVTIGKCFVKVFNLKAFLAEMAL